MIGRWHSVDLSARRLTQGAMTLHGILTGNEKIINKAKDKEGNITIKLQGGLTQEAFDKICKAVNNSNFQGNVRIQFQ